MADKDSDYSLPNNNRYIENNIYCSDESSTEFGSPTTSKEVIKQMLTNTGWNTPLYLFKKGKFKCHLECLTQVKIVMELMVSK